MHNMFIYKLRILVQLTHINLYDFLNYLLCYSFCLPKLFNVKLNK